MNINELIAELQELKETCGGDTAVCIWEYNGGGDSLFDVTRVRYNSEEGCITVNSGGW